MLFLAISSSIDSFGIGITYGIRNTKISNLAKFSSPSLPLTSTPSLLALPTPQKYPKGTEITKAHGQAVTKNIKAL